MRKTFILLAILLQFSSMLKAQYASVGTKWYYGIRSSNGNPSIEGVYSYICEKDTTINSETYSKIVYNAIDDSISRIFYLTKDSVNVYYWRHSNKRVLFKTKANTNDTILIDCFLSNHTYPYQDTVIAINVVINKITYQKSNALKNDSLKLFEYRILNFTGIPFSSPVGTFSEVLINTNNDFNRDLLVLTQQLGIPSGGDYLRCFNSMNYNYKSIFAPIKISCDFSNVGIYELIKKNDLSIYPNPNNGLFTLSFNDITLRQVNIFDVLGNLVSTFVSVEKEIHINLRDKANGIYFVNVLSDKGQFNSRIVLE